MNKVYTGIGAVAVIGIAYIAFSPMPETDYQPTPSPAVRVDSFKEGFMEGCTEDAPELYDYCNCTYNYFDLTMEKSEMMSFGIEVEKNPELPIEEYPQEMIDAIIFCADKI